MRLVKDLRVVFLEDIRTTEGFTSIRARVEMRVGSSTSSGGGSSSCKKGSRKGTSSSSLGGGGSGKDDDGLIQFHFDFRRQPAKSSSSSGGGGSGSGNSIEEEEEEEEQIPQNKRRKRSGTSGSSSNQEEEEVLGTLITYTIAASRGFKSPPVGLLEGVVEAHGSSPSSSGIIRAGEEWTGGGGEERTEEEAPDQYMLMIDFEAMEEVVERWVGSSEERGGLGVAGFLHFLVLMPFWEEEWDWVDICLSDLVETDEEEEEGEEG